MSAAGRLYARDSPFDGSAIHTMIIDIVTPPSTAARSTGFENRSPVVPTHRERIHRSEPRR